MRAYEDEVALIEAVAPRLVAACPPEVEVRRGEGGTNALDAHYVMSIVPARTDASKLCLFAYAAGGVAISRWAQLPRVYATTARPTRSVAN